MSRFMEYEVDVAQEQPRPLTWRIVFQHDNTEPGDRKTADNVCWTGEARSHGSMIRVPASFFMYTVAMTFFSDLKTAFLAWKGDNAARLGAAIAYYAVFSLAPLLII